MAVADGTVAIVDFAVLGPVLVDGQPPRGAIERRLLARLLMAPGAPVSTGELVEAAWPEERRAAAAASLRVRLSKLRALLEPDRERGAAAEVLVRDPAGYRLVVAPGSVDAERFARAGRGGRAAAAGGGARPLRGKRWRCGAASRSPTSTWWRRRPRRRGACTRMRDRLRHMHALALLEHGRAERGGAGAGGARRRRSAARGAGPRPDAGPLPGRAAGGGPGRLPGAGASGWRSWG